MSGGIVGEISRGKCPEANVLESSGKTEYYQYYVKMQIEVGLTEMSATHNLQNASRGKIIF